MTTPGYQDYERLSLQSGILLYGANVPITTGIVPFRGYVGNIAYINSFWNANGGLDSYAIELLFATDSTFATIVAQVVSYRNGNSEGYRQYALLSPWLQLQLIPKAGGSATTVQVAFYGNMATTSANKLGGFTKSIFDQEGNIGAGVTVTTTLTAIAPGSAVVSIFTNAASWDIQLQQYDFPSNAFATFWHMNSASTNDTGSFNIAMPDTVTRMVIFNNDAAAKNFAVHLMPLMEG